MEQNKEIETKYVSEVLDGIERIEIEGTDYSLYRSAQNAESVGDAQIQFGVIRSSGDFNTKYVHPDHQEQYPAIASFTVEYCRDWMVNKCGLVRENFEEDSTLFISEQFFSGNEENNKGKTALVLIQGTGAVRSGIWARSVCINDSLLLGSMLPQVEWAVQKGYPVLVMDPNAGSDMETHATQVWDNYIQGSGFSCIHIIAHSAGGGCLSAIQNKFMDSFFEQAGKIAYTDSWVISANDLVPSHLEFMQNNAIHYEASDLPLGQQISSEIDVLGIQNENINETITCKVVSAGHNKHEYTTGCAWPKIIQQFDQKVVSMQQIVTEQTNKQFLGLDNKISQMSIEGKNEEEQKQ